MPKSNRKWPTLPITKEWRAALRAELVARGRGSQRKLAKYLRVNPSLLSKMLSPTHMRSSTYVVPISRWAKIPLPVTDSSTSDWIRVGAILREDAPKRYRELLETAKRIAAVVERTKKLIDKLDD